MDEIHGGNGRDIIQGGRGNDLLAGDKGRDTLRGNSGSDTLAGCRGAAGRVELVGFDACSSSLRFDRSRSLWAWTSCLLIVAASGAHVVDWIGPVRNLVTSMLEFR